MVQLRGSIIQLRQWRDGDEASLVKYAGNPKVPYFLLNKFPSPYTADDAKYWISLRKNQESAVNLAIEFNNEAIGGIGIEPRQDIYQKTALIGYWLAEPFWGKGFTTKAIILMTRYAFDNFDLARLQAGVFDSNTASMKVLEKAGYIKEGISRKAIYKHGRFYDEHVYTCLKPGL